MSVINVRLVYIVNLYLDSSFELCGKIGGKGTVSEVAKFVFCSTYFFFDVAQCAGEQPGTRCRTDRPLCTARHFIILKYGGRQTMETTDWLLGTAACALLISFSLCLVFSPFFSKGASHCARRESKVHCCDSSIILIWNTKFRNFRFERRLTKHSITYYHVIK